MDFPTSPLSQPEITAFSPMGKLPGAPVFHEASNSVPSRQMTPVYWTTSVSPFLMGAPSPSIRV